MIFFSFMLGWSLGAIISFIVLYRMFAGECKEIDAMRREKRQSEMQEQLNRHFDGYA